MNDTDFFPETEKFSAYYDLVSNARVVTYPEDKAAMDYQMLDTLSQWFGDRFMGMVGGLHYNFQPVKNIPAGTVAVPADNHTDPDTLLIRR